MKYLCTTAKPECINILVCPTTHVLITDNLPVRKNYFSSNIVQNDNAILMLHLSKKYFEVDVDRSTFVHTTSSRCAV